MTHEHCPCGDLANDSGLCAPCYAEHAPKLWRATMTPLETAYAAALDELSAAHADTLHLHDEPSRHPLAPPPFTRQRAIDVMHRAARLSGLRWVVVYDRGYFVVTEIDANGWHPRDARIAQSHCDGCNALLSEAMTALCAACSEAAQVAA